MKKVVRTISGVTPLAVMLKPRPCPHGKCDYCPSYSGVPESYTPTSPVVLRAIDCNYDPRRQVEARLKIMGLMGHATDKIELIVMGGTFTAYPADYRRGFVKGCFEGMNGAAAAGLEEAKKANETAKHRCVAMCLETRPDWCKEEHIDEMLDIGATRVEIGVQTLDDKTQAATHRGHGTAEVIEATRLLKDSCFKVGYHMMLGLPGATPESDVETFRTLFSDERFQPDQVKIYPTFVIKGTPLEKAFNAKDFKPYTTGQIVDTIVRIKQIVPQHVRIMRVMRDIPAQYIASDCRYSHLRDAIKERMNTTGAKCGCIRCREVGHGMRAGKHAGNMELKRTDYNASGGKEIFLSFESDWMIASLLRLRLPGSPFRPELDGAALVRELHTFGPQAAIGTPGEWQHKGYGRRLMAEAESVAKEAGYEKMAVIAGVGVREYFYKLGYKLDGPYVSKAL
ncbi:MAG: tRNA uridine(34) 5-carboxymethylaminomethyl modification radical SAM/GNAT enzyme Elp3 [Candidatus Aenigmatarchaeota archaeon]